jgi:hypothetical protein
MSATNGRIEECLNLESQSLVIIAADAPGSDLRFSKKPYQRPTNTPASDAKHAQGNQNIGNFTGENQP